MCLNIGMEGYFTQHNKIYNNSSYINKKNEYKTTRIVICLLHGAYDSGGTHNTKVTEMYQRN